MTGSDGILVDRRPTLNPNCLAMESAHENKILVVVTTPKTKGWGAVTLIRIPLGAWVGEYTGELLTRDQVEARYWKDTNDSDHANRNDNDNGNDNHFEKRHEEEDIAWLESRIRRNQGCSGDYLFDVGDDYFLDGEDSDVSGWCRFINHAAHDDNDEDDNCDACNLEARCSREVWNGKCLVPPRLWFVARRDIAPGEELQFDYGDSYWNRPS